MEYLNETHWLLKCGKVAFHSAEHLNENLPPNISTDLLPLTEWVNYLRVKSSGKECFKSSQRNHVKMLYGGVCWWGGQQGAWVQTLGARRRAVCPRACCLAPLGLSVSLTKWGVD